MRAGAIVAIASARGAAPRAVIRIAGPLACALAHVRFEPSDGGPYAGEKRGAQCGLWHLAPWHHGVPVDVWTFKGKASACGVDVVEVHLPSSPYLTEHLLADLVALGAALAQPGEFTRLAVENGCMDLARAEGVLGLIRARDDDEAKAARSRLSGGLSKVLESFEGEVVDLLVPIEAALDFSDQDFQSEVPAEAVQLAQGLASRLREFAAREEPLQRKESYRVVLRGSVNAGKSTLWNALTGGRAITSSDAGTTRDVLVGSFVCDHLEIHVVDTAGLGHSLGAIDTMAQSRTEREVEAADLVVAVADLRKNDFLGHEGLRVGTFADLYDGRPIHGVIPVCAHRGQGISELKSAIVKGLIGRGDPTPIVLGSRISCGIRDAASAVARGADALGNHPPEFAASDFREALRILRGLRIAPPGDPVLDRIFSSFCIGK